MALRRYKMAFSGTATAAGADSWTALRNGVIKQIMFNTIFNSITDGAELRVQVSRVPLADFGATAGVQTQALCHYYQAGNFVTSGLAQAQGNYACNLMDKIDAGDALYINTQIAGTVTANVDVTIVVDE